MSHINKRFINIFYYLDRPETYILYYLEGNCFVSFIDGGHGGVERTIQITKDSFNALMSSKYNFNQILNNSIKLKSLDLSLKIYSHTLCIEPYVLYHLVNSYYIELWKNQSIGENIAVEIKKEVFDQLFNETALPSEVL